MNLDKAKRDGSGGCHFTPCPQACLNCPYPECINNRPPVMGEDGIEHYIKLNDGIKDNPVEKILMGFMKEKRWSQNIQ